MINTLKQNMMQNSINPQQQGRMQPEQPMAVPPMPQQQPQPMQRQRPQQPANPHMQMIEGLQKQKGQLQKQYDKISPLSNSLGSAAESILNAQPGESAMRTLARGFLGASQGLRGAEDQKQENLRQQAEIDRAIANTHHFVQDYNYNKSIEREKLNMQHEELGLKREELGVRNMNAQRQLLHDMNKQNFEQQKFSHELDKNFQDQSKEIVQAYEQSKDLKKNVDELKHLLTHDIKDWSPLQASITSVMPKTALPVLSNQDLSKWAVMQKHLNELQTKYTQTFGNHNKLTNNIVEMVKSGKIDIGMGKKAMLETLNFIDENINKSLARDEFILDAMRKGVHKDIAMRGFDAYLDHPDLYKNPQEATADIAEKYRSGFAPKYSHGANAETENRENQSANRENAVQAQGINNAAEQQLTPEQERKKRAAERARMISGGQQ